MNKNVFATISHNECKDVLLNKRCIRHSRNKTQVKTTEQEHMKSAKFHCVILMTKFILKTMTMYIMDYQS